MNTFEKYLVRNVCYTRSYEVISHPLSLRTTNSPIIYVQYELKIWNFVECVWLIKKGFEKIFSLLSFRRVITSYWTCTIWGIPSLFLFLILYVMNTKIAPHVDIELTKFSDDTYKNLTKYLRMMSSWHDKSSEDCIFDFNSFYPPVNFIVVLIYPYYIRYFINWN